MDDDISFVLTDSTTKAKYKSSWLQTETTYYMYISEIVAGMNQDLINDGKIFTAASIQSSIMPDGYYIQKTTMNAQYIIFGTGNRIYPVGIHPSNEAVYDMNNVLMEPIFHYESGRHTTGWYAYWNG